MAYSGIIYDKSTGQVFRLVVTDDIHSLHLHLQPGESLLVSDRQDLVLDNGLPDPHQLAAEIVRLRVFESLARS